MQMPTPESLSLGSFMGGQALGVIPTCCQVQRRSPWKLTVCWQQFTVQLELAYVPLKRLTRLADDLAQCLQGGRRMLYAKDYGVPPAISIASLLPGLPLLVLQNIQRRMQYAPKPSPSPASKPATP